MDPSDFVDGFFDLLMEYWKWAAVALAVIAGLVIVWKLGVMVPYF